MTSSDGTMMTITRSTSEFKPHWQRFQTALIAPSHQVAAIHDEAGTQHPYQRQYAHVYHQRHAQLGPQCHKAFANSKQQQQQQRTIQQVQRLLELEDEVPSFVVGTLVKEANSKASSSSSSDSDNAPLVEGTECRPNDVLYLEDESGRVALQFENNDNDKSNQNQNNLYPHEYCTGLVVGVQGYVTRGGSMLVESIVLPDVNPPTPLAKTPKDDNDNAAPCLLFLSGLWCGSTRHGSLTRDMLLTFLEGRLSSSNDSVASRISRIVICGGLVDPEMASPDALRDLDAFVFQLTAGAGIPVDLLPGARDPTTANWPQRPIHSSLLRQSSAFGLVTTSPNPHASYHGCCSASIEDKNHNQDNNRQCYVLATDGTNVRDLQKHIVVAKKQGQKENSNNNESEIQWTRLTELQAMKRQLRAGHICPTGPTSVPTMPHANKDPMVLYNHEWPHVYVAGNCSRFATTTLASSSNSSNEDDDDEFCRLICVPSFAATGEAVVLNLATRKVELLRFQE